MEYEHCSHSAHKSTAPLVDWPELLGVLMASGLTQREIAAHVGRSLRTVQTWRSGVVNDLPYSDGVRLLALARLRGCAFRT